MLIPLYSECMVYEIPKVFNTQRNRNTVSFLNASYNGNFFSTREIIKKEKETAERINDRQLVKEFYNNASDIFGSCSESFVLSEYEKMRNAFIELSFDKFYTDISKSDECLFIYGIKGDLKLFFNLFFEGNIVEALVNISTPDNKYVLDGDIESCVSEMFQILN